MSAPTVRHHVEHDHAATYGEVVGLPIGDDGIVPIGYPLVLAWEALVAAGFQAIEGAVSGIVHVSQDLRAHVPARVGDELTTSCTLTGARPLANGGLLRITTTCVNEAGTTVFDADTVAAVEGAPLATIGDAVRPGRPARGLPVDRSWRASVDVEPDLATRYAAASGDRNAVHLDVGVARALGFRQPILHGLCSLLLAAGRCIRGVERAPSEIIRVAGRFSVPVYPGTQATLEVDVLERGDLGFRLVTDDGPAIRDGFVGLRAS